MLLHSPNIAPLALDQPRCMGVLNVTPDSFSDGGRFSDAEAAVQHGIQLARQGASVIDVGGESTRPGSQRTTARVQLERVLPVIRELRPALDREHPETWISIDTTLSDVAGPAIEAGANLINDISAGRDDPALFELAGQHKLPVILMHMQGEPATMQQAPHYENVLSEVRDFLLSRAGEAEAAGVGQVVLDPGIGFGKTLEHNLTLLAHLDSFVATGYPVLLGASRKGFIGRLSPATAQAAADRVPGTCATTALGVQQGVRLFRVHDVPENLQAAQVAYAILNANTDQRAGTRPTRPGSG